MNDILIKENMNIKDKIYFVRGKYVMLDSDLAKLYECTNGTKQINQAVKRNIKRFPDDFYFQLTTTEYNNLKSQFVTSSYNDYGGVRKLPYVFTEQGVSMLASVLKTEKAAETSIKIIRTFIEMKNYLFNNNMLEQKHFNNMIFDLDNRVSILEEYLPNFKLFSNQIFYEGEIYDSYSLLLDIFNDSKDNIIIIDNYISKELLDILSRINVNIIIYTRNIDNTLLSKYSSQYNNINIKIDNRFHDRFIIIDNKVLYHCGASFKDLGKKCFCISIIDDKEILNGLLCKL